MFNFFQNFALCGLLINSTAKFYRKYQYFFVFLSPCLTKKEEKMKKNIVKSSHFIGDGKFQYSKLYISAFLFTFYLDLWKQKSVKKLLIYCYVVLFFFTVIKLSLLCIVLL